MLIMIPTTVRHGPYYGMVDVGTTMYGNDDDDVTCDDDEDDDDDCHGGYGIDIGDDGYDDGDGSGDTNVGVADRYDGYAG